MLSKCDNLHQHLILSNPWIIPFGSAFQPAAFIRQMVSLPKLIKTEVEMLVRSTVFNNGSDVLFFSLANIFGIYLKHLSAVSGQLVVLNSCGYSFPYPV